MMFAKSPISGSRVRPAPGLGGICPSCGGLLRPKCGEINVWHWAHAAADCDPWSEGESYWHVRWKERFPVESCEVVKGAHRADIVARGGSVIELQHSSLSPLDVRRREYFYGDMMWVLNASEFAGNFCLRPRGGFFSFRWLYPRKWTFTITHPLLFDLGDDRLFLIRRLHKEVPCGGWGNMLSISDFVSRYSELSQTNA